MNDYIILASQHARFNNDIEKLIDRHFDYCRRSVVGSLQALGEQASKGRGVLVLDARLPWLCEVTWQQLHLHGLPALLVYEQEMPGYVAMPAVDTLLTDVARLPLNEREMVFRLARLLGQSAQPPVTNNAVQKAASGKETRLQNLVELQRLALQVFAHELNEPLVSLTSFVNLLFKNNSAFSREEIKFVSDNIKNNLHSLSGFMFSMLDWTRLEAQEHFSKKESIELHQLTEEAARWLQEEYRTKKLNLQNRIAPKVTATHNRRALSLALMLLLSNIARNCNRYSNLLVTVKDQPNGQKQLVLETDGLMLGEKQLHNLFVADWYFTAPLTTFERSAGLAFILARKLLKKAGGDLQSRRLAGGKLAFYVNL